MTKKRLASYGINLGIVAAVYVILLVLMNAGVINRYYSGIITMVGINIILAVSLNLATGFLGELVLGHAGFMAVGAYCSALITMNMGIDEAIAFPISLLAGGLLAAVVGFLIGIPALRLKGDYLAIITLGFGEIIRVVLTSMDNITGGARGLSGIPALTDYSWVFFIAALTVFLCYTLIHSRDGRQIITIREDEIASEASGVNTTYIKMLAFVISAFFAGIAGGLYAHHIGVLEPSKFDFNYSVEILVMVVLGGMGSVTGSIIAAIVLTILPEALREFADYRMLLYSALLIVMMLFKPLGLLGKVEFSLAGLGRALKRLRHKNHAAKVAKQIVGGKED